MSTIKQIAKKAGVSPTTVSNVLHGKTAKVSPQILEKVQSIIDEENYTPNMGAVILARRNSRIIGVIMFMEPRSNETILDDPFCSTILGVTEQEIRRNGYFTMLHTTCDKDEVLRLAATWKLDGLILLWVPGEICSIIRKSIDTPVVFIDCYFNDDGQVYNNIGLNDKRGGYEMTRYLLSMGHTKIAFLANAQFFPSGDHERFEGYKEAFHEKEISFRDEWFIPLSKTLKERHALYRRLTTEPFPFTALFFSSDFYASDAITFFQDHSIAVPQRISVTGFDNNIYSRLIRPRLTTVHQDVFQKGKSAVSMLMRLIKKEPVPDPDVRLPVHLEIRDSVEKILPGNGVSLKCCQ